MASLKDQNRYGLFSLLVANVLVYYIVVKTQSLEFTDWKEALLNATSAIPIGVALALTAVINSQLPSRAKELIVFWEWIDPLPGNRAFSKYLDSDPRIDAPALRSAFAPLPVEPIEQNRLWYRFYRDLQNDPAVTSLSRGYLFARDYASIVTMMLLIFGAMGVAQITAPFVFITYILFLFVQIAVAIRSARNNAVRLVTTVLAIKSTSLERVHV